MRAEDNQNALASALKKFKDAKNSIEGASTTQKNLAEALFKWSLQENNRAIKDVTFQLNELVCLWGEVQAAFGTNLCEVAKQLEHISETYKVVKLADRKVERCFAKEKKIRNALKRVPRWKKGGDIRLLEQKLDEAVLTRQLAEKECAKVRCEQEYVKMVRFKTGLVKLGESYLNMSTSCGLIFEAQHDISLNMQIPSDDRQIAEMRYSGSAYCHDRVEMARAELSALDLSSSSSGSGGSSGNASNHSRPTYRQRRSNESAGSAASRALIEPPPPYHHFVELS